MIVAVPPHPDPAPVAAALHRKATVSGSYWVDEMVFVDGQIVPGVRGRCFRRVHFADRCFIIRWGVR